MSNTVIGIIENGINPNYTADLLQDCITFATKSCGAYPTTEWNTKVQNTDYEMPYIHVRHRLYPHDNMLYICMKCTDGMNVPLN